MKFKDKFEFKTIIFVAGIGLCVFLSAFLLFERSMQLENMQKRYDDNNKNIQELQSQITNLTDTNTDTVQQIQTKLSSAATAGSKVASLQNSYSDYSATSPSGMQSIKDTANAIQSYLDDNSITARVPWYNVNGKVSCKWAFESTYSFSGDTIPVLWECRDNKTNDLLAYTIGTYVVSSGKFKDVAYHMTQLGTTYIPGTQNNGTSAVFNAQ